MKKKIVLLFFFIISFSVFGETTQNNSANLSCTVLYTCGVDEDFYHSEYYSNMKIDGNKFSCITDSNDGLTLVLNGEKIITASGLWVYWVDLTSKDKCVYTYVNDEEEFIVIDGQKYGPYDDIKYNSYYCANGVVSDTDLLYNKNKFFFQRMGRIYRHDNDGSIYECEGESVWAATEKSPIYKSYNGKHTAQFFNNYRKITVDNNDFVLPIDKGAYEESIRLEDFFITNDGVCVVKLAYEVKNGGWKYSNVFIYSNTLKDFSEKEYFDPTTNSFKAKSNNLCGSRQFEDFWWWNRGNISLQDKTKKHLFTANCDYEYVMIDDKKYGNSTPINAFYDEGNDAFGWVCIEGKQLVLYSYKL